MSIDDNLLAGTPGVGFGNGALGNVGVLNVKVLFEGNELLLAEVNVLKALKRIRRIDRGKISLSDGNFSWFMSIHKWIQRDNETYCTKVACASETASRLPAIATSAAIASTAAVASTTRVTATASVATTAGVTTAATASIRAAGRQEDPL